MEFTEIAADEAFNDADNLHVICFRRGTSCFMPNQVLVTTTSTKDDSLNQPIG